MGKGTDLELVLVTAKDAESNECGPCGPDTCPWIDCGPPSN